MRQISVAQLFEARREALALNHVCGALERVIMVSEPELWPADLVGHLNLIHPERIQIIGNAELAWVRRQPQERAIQHLEDVLSARPPAIIVADGCELPNLILNDCKAHDIALFTTAHDARYVMDQLRALLARELSEKTSLHGVFVDVLGIGVFITGDSGTGKSELALELISRGHGLVADDVIEFSRIAPTVIEGRCPPLLQDFIEVRGLGMLNIRTIFGETASRRKMRLRLIVHLERRTPGHNDPDRLPLQMEMQSVLGCDIPYILLPVAVGRNLAVLLEAAVRSTILKLRGIDATQEFIEHHQRIMDGDKSS